DLDTMQIQDTGLRFPPKGRKGTYAYSVGDKIHSAMILGNGKFAKTLLLGHGSHIWWDDGGWPFDARIFQGGALYSYKPASKKLECLGIPVQRNTIHGLFGGDGFAAGYSLPDNHFFSFDYETGEMCDFGKISAYCCHSLGCVGKKVFGVYRRSMGEQRGDAVVANNSGAFLFFYDHDARQLERTEILIDPLETNIRFNSGMDSWVSTPAGLIGGRVDGTLFLLDTERLAIEELCYAIEPTHPSLSREQIRKLGGSRCTAINGSERITSMEMLDKNHIIGTAGFPIMHVFVYDLAARRSFDLGPVNPDTDMCYFHDMVITRPDAKNIRLALAETDSGLANLHILNMPAEKICQLTSQEELLANPI
ncbi:MAG TPA: hypothetical protein PLK08_07060, partial [Phycisphaerae bacterium]|nr:hypothetical protein [Phycisphaerae bacterium]